MTEPDNDNHQTEADEASARPTIRMNSVPSVDPAPSSGDEVGPAESAPEKPDGSNHEQHSGDIWSNPIEDAQPVTAKGEASDDFGSSESEVEGIQWADDEERVGPITTLNDIVSLAQPSTSDLSATAQTVRSWADQSGVAADPYVSELTNDLSNRRRLTYWASLEPLEYLPTPQISRGSALKSAARIVLLLRNVGVFVPVALTWLAINKSTDAFGRYVANIKSTKVDVTVNFLQFWQSGGDGKYLGSSWRIQHIALLDALVISVIILLTLAAGGLESRASARADRQQAEADRERTRLALVIGKALHGNRSASPESIGEALALALTDLSEAARNVAASTTHLENSTSGFDSLMPRLESLNQQISNLNQHFATDVVNSVSSLSTSVGTLGTTLGGDMNRFLSDVLAGIEEINESFKKTSVTVEFGTKQLRDDLDAIHRNLSQVIGRR